MSDPNKKAKSEREAKLTLVAVLYKKGYSYQKIGEEIMLQLNLSRPPPKSSIHSYVHFLLQEWREARIVDMDLAVQLELERIDDAIRELWHAWEKSKEDQKLTYRKNKGAPVMSSQSDDSNRSFRSSFVEQGERTEICFGDPRFLAEIRMQLVERRKLLGLYAPDKSELTGKNGKPLLPASAVDTSTLTEEERAALLAISRKVKR